MTTHPNTQAEPTLLPCPFCGGPVQLEKAHVRHDPIHGERQFYGVVCRNTTNLGGSCCMEQVPSASKDAAIARWNRRTPPASPRADVADPEDAKGYYDPSEAREPMSPMLIATPVPGRAAPLMREVSADVAGLVAECKRAALEYGRREYVAGEYKPPNSHAGVRAAFELLIAAIDRLAALAQPQHSPITREAVATLKDAADRIERVQGLLDRAQPQQERAITVEDIIRVCVPGGALCDPQQVADELRRYFKQRPQQEVHSSIYVVASECRSCGHTGINDCSATESACSVCDWSGPAPQEDSCPGCGKTGTMRSACPKCGGLYRTISEARIQTKQEVPTDDRFELLEEIARLQKALHFWLPDVPSSDYGNEAAVDRIGDDAMLLIGNFDADPKSAYELGLVKLVPPPKDAPTTDDVRELSKWLNEEVAAPINRQALARVLASVQQPQQRGELPSDATQPRLTVRLQSFPETNGKRNWTALLVRVGAWDGLIGNCGGITVARGEFWNRVAYEAERAKFLIGERDTEPDIMDYGADIRTPDEWPGEVRAALAASQKGGE